MQADFLPHDPERNPHGAAGVAEGLDIDTIVKLVDMAVDSGATVCATRDTRSTTPASPRGRAVPGALRAGHQAWLSPPIAARRRARCATAAERVFVAFKGMHEDIDSGASCTEAARGGCRGATVGREASMCPMGCAMAPWTGAIVLKNSSIAMATAEGGNPDDIDMDAPPDVLALMPDGRDPGARR